MKHPEGFVTTVTAKLLTYALGRELEYYEAPAVRKIVRGAARHEYCSFSLILGIVKSIPVSEPAEVWRTEKWQENKR
jgi:Protein of unknown function (DUF1585)